MLIDMIENWYLHTVKSEQTTNLKRYKKQVGVKKDPDRIIRNIKHKLQIWTEYIRQVFYDNKKELKKTLMKQRNRYKI